MDGGADFSSSRSRLPSLPHALLEAKIGCKLSDKHEFGNKKDVVTFFSSARLSLKSM